MARSGSLVMSLDGSDIGYGTSYATPRVCAAAAEVLFHCMRNNWRHTPGMLKALLMKSSQPISSHIFETGAGRVDLMNAIAKLYELEKVNNLPIITYIHPNQLPFSGQKIYSNSRNQFTISVFTSDIINYSLTVFQEGNIVEFPSSIVVIQANTFPISITPLEADVSLEIALESENAPCEKINLDLHVITPLSRIAIDTSLTVNANFTSFGRYQTLIETLDGLNVSVSEFNTLSSFLDADLRQYDALWTLSPYSSNMDGLNPWDYISTVHQHSYEHTQKITDYVEDGGNVFLAANLIQFDRYDNIGYEMCAFSLNLLLEGFPVSIGPYSILDETNPTNITDFASHDLTFTLVGIQHVGPVLLTEGNTNNLAWIPITLSNGSIIQAPKISIYSHMNSGTLVISSSDYFLSNVGLTTSPHLQSHIALIENIAKMFM